MLLSEMLYSNSKSASKYSRVRDAARTKMIKYQTICQKCGYDKHVESCHVRPLSETPLDTDMEVVNSEKNILILCRNCHWEMDNQDKCGTFDLSTLSDRIVREPDTPCGKCGKLLYSNKRKSLLYCSMECSASHNGSSTVEKVLQIKAINKILNEGEDIKQGEFDSYLVRQQRLRRYMDPLILHRMVWDRPATEVARELSMTSRGVKKLCQTRNIPTPPRGWWMKLKSGNLNNNLYCPLPNY